MPYSSRERGSIIDSSCVLYYFHLLDSPVLRRCNSMAYLIARADSILSTISLGPTIYLSVLGPRPNQRITRGGILSTYLGVHPYNSFTPDGGRPSVTKYPANTSTTFEMKLTSKRHKSSFYRNIMWLLSQFIMSFHYVISLCLFIITFHDRSGVISQPKLPGSIRYPVWPPIHFKYDGKTSFVTGYW